MGEHGWPGRDNKWVDKIVFGAMLFGDKTKGFRMTNNAKGKLTDAHVTRLIGHNNVMYYNLETKALNTNRYNGYLIYEERLYRSDAGMFKGEMEKEPSFGAQYEMTAPVIMTIDGDMNDPWLLPVSNPIYRRDGKVVVGNIIVKNKANGEYELYCKSWVRINSYGSWWRAVDDGLLRFMSQGGNYPAVRAALMRAHTR